MPKKLQIIEVKDYGDEQINRLALADEAFRNMESGERLAAFRFFKSRYSKEWPSDDY